MILKLTATFIFYLVSLNEFPQENAEIASMHIKYFDRAIEKLDAIKIYEYV